MVQQISMNFFGRSAWLFDLKIESQKFQIPILASDFRIVKVEKIYVMPDF